MPLLLNSKEGRLPLTEQEMRAADVELGPPSDGETGCTGCWDESDWDTSADTDIPKGEPVYYHQCNYEYDEWDAYCEACARKRAQV
jgi:hypothetical protein